MEGLSAAGVSETTMMHCRFLPSSHLQRPPDIQFTTHIRFIFFLSSSLSSLVSHITF